MRTPVDVLRDTALIVAERDETHGDWHDNMRNTAELWSAYLRRRVTARQVAVMLGLMKVSRMACGGPNQDDYDDLVGYAAIAAALDEEEENKAV